MKKVEQNNLLNHVIQKGNIIYSVLDTCPSCGRYTPDGEVCMICLKEVGLYTPKEYYCED